VAAALMTLQAGAPAYGANTRPWGGIAPPASGLVAPVAPAGPLMAAGKDQGWGAQGPDGLSPEEKARIQRQYKEWKTMPPEQKENLRRRQEEWNRMPSEDRQRYQERYRQWKQVPPEERRKLERNLRQWEELSPQERDSIRQRFRN
jgi:hypothetical protein